MRHVRARPVKRLSRSRARTLNERCSVVSLLLPHVNYLPLARSRTLTQLVLFFLSGRVIVVTIDANVCAHISLPSAIDRVPQPETTITDSTHSTHVVKVVVKVAKLMSFDMTRPIISLRKLRFMGCSMHRPISNFGIPRCRFQFSKQIREVARIYADSSAHTPTMRKWRDLNDTIFIRISSEHAMPPALNSTLKQASSRNQPKLAEMAKPLCGHVFVSLDLMRPNQFAVSPHHSPGKRVRCLVIAVAAGKRKQKPSNTKKRTVTNLWFYSFEVEVFITPFTLSRFNCRTTETVWFSFGLITAHSLSTRVQSTIWSVDAWREWFRSTAEFRTRC